MPNWIENPHASFVLAAYAVAAVALIGLAIASWSQLRRRAKEWQALQHTRRDQA